MFISADLLTQKQLKKSNKKSEPLPGHIEMDTSAEPSDTVMSEAAAPPPPQPAAAGFESIPATLSHGGRFIQYNIFGNIFEVTAKYKPPIMPIGKGAYGIVWSLSLSLSL